MSVQQSSGKYLVKLNVPEMSQVVKFPISEEECVKIGGHCYVVYPYIPKQEPFIRVAHCKHCGKRVHFQKLSEIERTEDELLQF